MYPESLKNLIESFKMLPGIGEKTAERLAFYVIGMDEENTSFFADSIKLAKEKIKKCSICNGITDKDVCDICSSSSRNKNVLCVVEDPKSIFLFEKIGVFSGEYHVIDGLISPLDGVDPDDIGLEKLFDRIHKGLFTKDELLNYDNIYSHVLNMDTVNPHFVTPLYVKQIEVLK